LVITVLFRNCGADWPYEAESDLTASMSVQLNVLLAKTLLAPLLRNMHPRVKPDAVIVTLFPEKVLEFTLPE